MIYLNIDLQPLEGNELISSHDGARSEIILSSANLSFSPT